MHKRAFDAALRAALKITFSTTLLAGCGGTVDVDETNPAEVEPDDPAGTSTTGATSGGSGGDGSIALPAPTPRPDPRTPRPREECEAPLTPPVDWWTFDEHTFACCAESLAAAIPAGDPTPWVEASQRDMATYNCCTQVTHANMDALWSGHPVPYPAPEGVLEACCELQTGVPTCTPWGPPMPPAMGAADWATWLALDDEGAALAELSRVA
jgi:hypothetical protein